MESLVVITRSPRPRTALRRLTRPPAIVALAIVAAIPFGSIGALQERIVSGRIVDTIPQGRFLSCPRDDAAAASYRMAGLHRRPPQRPAVYLLGGSSMRECFVSARSLSVQIQERCGVATQVVPLAASEESLFGALAIADALPVAEGGVIVLGIHHTPFAYGIAGARRQLHGREMMIKSTALHDFLEAWLGEELDASLHNGIAEYLTTYRDRRGVTAFNGPPIAHVAHRYPPSMATSDAFKRSRVREWLTGRGRPGGPFFSNLALNRAVIEAFVTTARDKGFQVLFMESPQNAAIIGDAFDPYKAEYRAICDAMVRDHGAHYVNLNEVAGLRKTDFRDLLHLFPTGYAKWQPHLADAIAQIFIDHPPATPTPSPSPAP
jgi:hypothetical protein